MGASSKERQATFRTNQKLLGREQYGFWLSPAERDAVRYLLKHSRRLEEVMDRQLAESDILWSQHLRQAISGLEVDVLEDLRDQTDRRYMEATDRAEIWRLGGHVRELENALDVLDEIFELIGKEDDRERARSKVKRCRKPSE